MMTVARPDQPGSAGVSLRGRPGRGRLLDSAVPSGPPAPLATRIAVCGFAAGGLAALDAIDRAGYEVLGPTLSSPAARLAPTWPGPSCAASTGSGPR